LRSISEAKWEIDGIRYRIETNTHTSADLDRYSGHDRPPPFMAPGGGFDVIIGNFGGGRGRSPRVGRGSGSGAGPSGGGKTSTPTGQRHHPISKPIYDELQRSPGLRDQYKPRDPRFVTQARDYGSHNGYQEWHRRLDAEVRQWIRDNPQSTPRDFENWLRARYQRQDLRDRFPNGVGGAE
jgi:hypothetical protein